MDDEAVLKIAKLNDSQFSLVAGKVELLAKLNKTGAGYIPEGTINILLNNLPSDELVIEKNSKITQTPVQKPKTKEGAK
jgi:hypothetical protein